MIKPKHLCSGDTIAIVSLSAGTLGESWAIHKLHIARQRLEQDYRLKVKVMPNALKGRQYLYEHPEARSAATIPSACCPTSISTSSGKTPRSSPAFPTLPPITL